MPESWNFPYLCRGKNDSADGRKYWDKLKQRLKEERNETVTNCHQLKLPASDPLGRQKRGRGSPEEAVAVPAARKSAPCGRFPPRKFGGLGGNGYLCGVRAHIGAPGPAPGAANLKKNTTT